MKSGSNGEASKPWQSYLMIRTSIEKERESFSKNINIDGKMSTFKPPEANKKTLVELSQVNLLSLVDNYRSSFRKKHMLGKHSAKKYSMVEMTSSIGSQIHLDTTLENRLDNSLSESVFSETKNQENTKENSKIKSSLAASNKEVEKAAEVSIDKLER